MPPQNISSESWKRSRNWSGRKGGWAKLSRAEGTACAKAQRKCLAHLRLEGLSWWSSGYELREGLEFDPWWEN